LCRTWAGKVELSIPGYGELNLGEIRK